MPDPKAVTPDELAATHLSGTANANPTSTGVTTSSGPGASQAAELLAGRYQLLGLVAVGGMGAVYRARDLELDEVVALKMLRRELVDAPDVLTRFRQEVKLARRVTHTNVARTYDIHEHDGQRFLTMELIDGEPLTDLVERTGALPLARTVEIASAICAGLAAAHAADVVHRDLKPDNVLLAKDGRVVITDFGIARALAGSQAALATMGMPIGTPAYMAPEQVEGSQVDARADIYAVGEILYEMLTGERAWQGESIYQVAAARIIAPPPDPRAKNHDIPTGAALLVLRCMAKNPAQRPATIGEVAEALQALTLPAPAVVGSSPNVRAAAGAAALQGPVSRRGASPAVALDEAAQAAVATPAGAKTVAVMPFRNAGAAEDEYLADGLTEDLIDTLSMSDGVRVRALGAVLQHKGKTSDPREFGRELGVQVVVDGSVRKLADQMRVSARLVSVADGFQLWAKRFERSAADFLKVGDEIADAIASAITVERGTAHRGTPADPVALDLYLRARHEYHKFGKEPTERAVALFEQAMARAPRDPVILSGYAMAQLRLVIFGDDQFRARDLALAAAEKAMQIAPSLPEPRVALAGIHLALGDAEKAAVELMKSFETSKTSPDAHEMLGRILGEVGPLEGAIRHLEVAQSLEPRLTRATFELARMYVLLGDDEHAHECLERASRENDTTQPYWLTIARLLLWRNDVERARAYMARTGPDAPVGPARGLLEKIASRELSFEAPLVTTTTSQLSRRRVAFFRQIAAEVAAVRGDAEGCLAATAESAGSGLQDVVWMDRCPVLAFVRSDPRFQEIRGVVAARAGRIRAALGMPEA